MYTIVWNYDFLLRKASELEECLPDLIKNNEWDLIEGKLQISKTEWDGAAADAYKDSVARAVRDHREDVILRTPSVIRNVVKEMKEREARIAEANKNAFGGFSF